MAQRDLYEEAVQAPEQSLADIERIAPFTNRASDTTASADTAGLYIDSANV